MKTKKWRMQSMQTIVVCMISFMLFNFLTTVSLNIFIPEVAALKEMSVSILYHANTIGNLISVVFALSVGITVSYTHLTLPTIRLV